MDKELLLAVDEARVGLSKKDGGPFGTIIVNKEGKIIGRGHNCVCKNNDPTAHAEVMAIRNACHNTNNYHLTDCIIYTTTEPCPMCLSAIVWADIKKVIYSTTRTDAANIGFKDEDIYDYLEGKNLGLLSVKKVENIECEKLLHDYNDVIY